jgi:4-hydroxy-3-methylbut-2-enyl diphosphate reductase
MSEPSSSDIVARRGTFQVPGGIVTVAENAGFCWGVRRAMDIAEEALDQDAGIIHTLGPLIHNAQEIERLESQGVKVIAAPEELAGGTVVIRAHGIAPQVRETLKESGSEVRDATCPVVLKSERIVVQALNRGCDIVIIGDRDHPEMIGLMGYVGERGYVIETEAEARELPRLGTVCVLCQTTLNEDLFMPIAEAIASRADEVELHNTVCGATTERQTDVHDLAKRVDCMVIIGGKHSGNTQRLHQIALNYGVPAFHIETGEELASLGLERYEHIGITAGASSPDWIIEEVLRGVERIKTEAAGKAQGDPA